MNARNCAVCGRPFQPKSWNAKFCPLHRGSPDPTGRYGWQHQKRRASWASRVASGEVSCARCGWPIQPGERWDLDHADDGDGYLGPSHVRCNRATAGGARRGRGNSRPQPAPVSHQVLEDDPEKGIYWGPRDPQTGDQLRWSEPWFEWR